MYQVKKFLGYIVHFTIGNKDIHISFVAAVDQLTKLKELAKRIFPDLDVLDLSLPDLKNVLQSSSISDIRKDLLNATKKVFRFIYNYSFLIKKVIYIISAISLFHQGYK